MAPPKQPRLSHSRKSSSSSQPTPPTAFDFDTTKNNAPSHPPAEFSTTEKSSRWTFSSSTRLQSILSSSTANLIGVRPLSPPSLHHHHHHPRKQGDYTLQPPNNDSSLLQQRQVHFTQPPSHRSSRRKSNKRSKNLAEYFPFVEDGRSKKRRRSQRVDEVDHFATLPDEMILRILRNLPKPCLGRMALVNKRFSRLVRDESLWEKIDCMGLTLGAGQLDVICKRRPAYLRLARGTIPSSPLLTLPSPLPLLYLDLTMTLVDPSTLAALLSHCHKLTHLSLEHCNIDGQVLKGMKASQASISVLNLSMCYDLGAEGLAEYFHGCTSLTQLNLACVSQTPEKWTEAQLETVIGSLPPSLQQLNISGFRYIMRDAHTSILSTRLPALIDLDLSDSQELTGRTLENLALLTNLQHLGLSRCYSIEPASYALLTSIKSLRYLELFSLFKEASIKSLASTLLQGIEINQFPFSAIARPTVGNRRSSIWGIRVRE